MIGRIPMDLLLKNAVIVTVNPEREIIYNVFEFSDALAKDIMIPKVNMVTVNVNDDYHEVLSVFRKHMYTRLPVYEKDKDNIIGLINIKDFILTDDPEHFQIRNILREAHFTYEYKKPGSTSWKTIGKRGATYKSVSFNIETTSTYQARVYIQDASDYVTVKTFKVTVS